MKRLALCAALVLGLLSWLGMRPASAFTAYQSPELEINFPDRLAGMTLSKVTDYEQEHPGLGTGISYRASDLFADFYIYNEGLKKIPNDLDSTLIKEHLKEVVSEVYAMQEQGVYEDVKELPAPAKTKIGKTNFLQVKMSYQMRGQEVASYIFLTVKQNQFFKIRFTYTTSGADDEKKLVLFYG